MLALGSDRETERERFDAHVGVCGVEADGEAFFCSRSCEELGRHFLIYPDNPYETYDDALARARAEGV